MSHPRQVGENLGRLLPRGEVHHLGLKDYDVDLSPREEWEEKEGDIAAIFIAFMKRATAGVPALGETDAERR